MNDGNLLTTEDVSKRLGVPIPDVRRFVRNRELACIQLSPRRRRFTEEQLADFLQRKTVEIVEKKSAVKVYAGPRKSRGNKGNNSMEIDHVAEVRKLCH